MVALVLEPIMAVKPSLLDVPFVAIGPLVAIEPLWQLGHLGH